LTAVKMTAATSTARLSSKRARNACSKLVTPRLVLRLLMSASTNAQAMAPQGVWAAAVSQVGGLKLCDSSQAGSLGGKESDSQSSATWHTATMRHGNQTRRNRLPALRPQ